jgi:hypothetical protein
MMRSQFTLLLLSGNVAQLYGTMITRLDFVLMVLENTQETAAV